MGTLWLLVWVGMVWAGVEPALLHLGYDGIAATETACGQRDREAALVHALVHGRRALRSQRPAGSADAIRAWSLLYEGEAELALLRVRAVRYRGRDLEAAALEALEARALLSGEPVHARPERWGAAAVGSALARGGQPAVDALFAATASTEQVLHAARRRDPPVAVGLPDLAGLAVGPPEVVGELGLAERLAALPAGRSATAVAGWSGDVEARVQSADGEATVLRVVLEREIDAIELAAAWREARPERVRARGRVVDVVGGAEALQGRLWRALEPMPSLASDPAAEAAGAQLDAWLRANGPALVRASGGRWLVEGLAVELEVPGGCRVTWSGLECGSWRVEVRVRVEPVDLDQLARGELALAHERGEEARVALVAGGRAVAVHPVRRGGRHVLAVVRGPLVVRLVVDGRADPGVVGRLFGRVQIGEPAWDW